MLKKIAAFLRDDLDMEESFGKGNTIQCYEELESELNAFGGELYIVRDQKSYLGNGIFKESWQFEKGVLLPRGEVKMDAVYDKGGFVADDIPYINCSEINEICSDKLKTYELFSDLCPLTFKVENKEDFKRALQKMPGELKVAKPIRGYRADSVYIGDDDSLLKNTYDFPILLQEFIDTSNGIPGITDTLHDFRVVMINGDIVLLFLRTPKEGSLISNSSQGGIATIIPIKDIPEEAKQIAYEVDEKLKKYGNRAYSIDLVWTNGKCKIIELNSKFALTIKSRGPDVIIFQKALAKLLTSL